MKNLSSSFLRFSEQRAKGKKPPGGKQQVQRERSSFPLVQAGWSKTPRRQQRASLHTCTFFLCCYPHTLPTYLPTYPPTYPPWRPGRGQGRAAAFPGCTTLPSLVTSPLRGRGRSLPPFSRNPWLLVGENPNELVCVNKRGGNRGEIRSLI